MKLTIITGSVLTLSLTLGTFGSQAWADSKIGDSDGTLCEVGHGGERTVHMCSDKLVTCGVGITHDQCTVFSVTAGTVGAVMGEGKVAITKKVKHTAAPRADFQKSTIRTESGKEEAYAINKTGVVGTAGRAEFQDLTVKTDSEYRYDYGGASSIRDDDKHKDWIEILSISTGETKRIKKGGAEWIAIETALKSGKKTDWEYTPIDSKGK